MMDFSLPPALLDYIKELDAFIEAEIKSLEDADDNVRFGNGPDAASGGGEAHLRQGIDVQLLGEPAVLRGGRPGDASAWHSSPAQHHEPRCP